MRATLESNPIRYLAWLYSSQLQRVIVGALFDIEGEIGESLKPGLDHQVAHSRLQWWREECERAAEGHPVHPLTQQLVAALRELPHLDPASLSRLLAGLSGFVDVTVWDLASATFETRRELTAYCERWAAAMIGPAVAEAGPAVAEGFARESAAPSTRESATPSAHASAAPSAHASAAPSTHASAVSSTHASAAPSAHVSAAPSTHASAAPSTHASAAPSAHASAAPSGHASAVSSTHASAPSSAGWIAIGVALRELEMLQDVARAAHSGKLRIPLDELQAAHVDPAALSKPPWPAALAKLQFDRHETLRAEIARILNGFNSQQQMAGRGIVVWAALACRSSKRVQRALPALPEPGRFDGLSDAWFAWRVARRATVGRFRLS
jgi:phytoene/squalene synthetase